MRKRLFLFFISFMAVSALSGCVTGHSHAYELVTGKAATCTESGVKDYYKCSGCDLIFDSVTKEEITVDSLTIEAKGHDYGDWVSDGDEQHKKICNRCSDVVRENHQWDQGVITTEPTHTEFGVKTYTCSICHGTKTESVNKLEGHTYTYTSIDDTNHKKECECGIDVTEAHTYGNWSKKDNDNHSRVCSLCSHEEVKAHTWNGGEITTQPTHLLAGEKTYTCADCGATKTEEIAKLTNHTYGDWESDGETTHTKTCECGETVTENHSWNGGEITTQPTHLAKGVKTYTCTVCGQTKTEEIDKLADHTYGDWTKVDDDNHKKVCECGDEVVEAHTWDDGVITTPSTHTEKGVKTYTCSVCHGTKTEELPLDTSWNHYAAVMPTAEDQGIREYWDNAMGGAPQFTAPADVEIKDKTLTKAEINALPAGDKRVIPTLTRIQAAVSKNYEGVSAYEYTFVRDAYAYKYLDTTTKASITSADAAAIEAAYGKFNELFTVVYDAGSDLLPILEQSGTSAVRGYDATYGDVLEITTELGSAGGTSALYFYGLERNGVTYGEKDCLQFAVYSPFAAAANTTQTYWVGSYNTAKKITADPQNWTFISSSGIELNSNESVKTSFGPAINLQRYVNGTIDPYTGTYKMTSIIAEKELTAEGSVVLRGKNFITDVKTWGATANETVVTYGIDTDYGKATQLDIKSKTAPVELQWTNFGVSKLANFEYARLYVYAKTTQRVYVSLANWRNNIVSIPGLEPNDAQNADVANSVGSAANVVADKWNVIDIPTSYLAQDTDGKIFIEIWNDVNEAKDGWLFSDLVGINSSYYNGRTLIVHNGVTVASAVDADLGVCTRVSLTGTSGFAKQAANFDISKFTTIEYSIKNEAATSIKVTLFKANDSAYAQNAAKKYVETTVAAGQTEKVVVNISDYFLNGSASTSKIYFQVAGAAGNSVLISQLVAKK